MPHYVIMYRPPRASFPSDATAEEGAAVSRHFAYLTELMNRGILLMAGRRDDAEYGIAIIECADLAAAREILSSDPVVQAGVFSARVDDFKLALWRK